MKTRIKTFLAILISVVIIVPIPLFAQSHENKIDKEFKWDNVSKTETLFITIKNNSSEMMVNLNATLKKGKLEVNLFDPDGEKIPGFMLVADGSGGDGNNSISVTNNNGKNTVSTSSSSSSSSSNSTSISDDKWGSSTFTTTTTAESGSKGVLSKVLTDPEPGKWKIVISTRDMTGELDVQVDQD